MFNWTKLEGPSQSTGCAQVHNTLGASPYPSTSKTTEVEHRNKFRHHSVVDAHLTIKGDLESDGDILLKGKAIGNITCKLLIIDADASIEGGIVAEEVVIRGKASGKINANRVRLERTANVDSEICHRIFSSEVGALIKGALRLNEEH